MESKSVSFMDEGKNVQITINHYHNEVRQQMNPYGSIGGFMATMLAAREFMQPVLSMMQMPQIQKQEEKALISDDSFIDDVKYEIVDDVENSEFLYFGIESSQKLGKYEDFVGFKGLMIQNLTISFQKDVEFEKLYKTSIHRNLFKAIQNRLSTMMNRTDLFLVSEFLDKDGNKFQGSCVFFDSNICEALIKKYSKKGDYVIMNEIVARKVKLPFASFIDRVDYVSELDGCYKVEKQDKGKYKISKI